MRSRIALFPAGIALFGFTASSLLSAAEPDPKAPLPIKLPRVDSPAVLRAGDSAEDTLNKVLQVYGGPEKMKLWARGRIRYRANGATLKVQIPEGVEPIAEDYFDYPGRFRRVVTLHHDGEDLTMTFVVDKGNGWMHSTGGDVRPLPRESLAAADRKEHLFAVFNNFTRLQGKGVTLSNLGEKTVTDRPAVVLKAKGEGMAETELYFDRASGLLLKSRAANSRPDLLPGDVLETSYSDYQRFQGMPFPTKLRSTSGGKPAMQIDVLEMNFLDKLDEKLFAKPG